MSIHISEIARMTDVTLTGACSTKTELDELLDFAKQHHFYSVIGPRCYNAYIAEALAGTDTLPSSGCCFPAGHDPSEVKAFHAKYAVSEGIREIDMVMNLPYFKSGLYQSVVDDIRIVKDAIGNEILLKCIIEVCFLNDDEIRRACELVIDGGAEYIKTATGLQGPTTLHHVEVVAEAVKDRAKIKAAGGIRDIKTMEKMIDLGVDRFGISYQSVRKIFEK